MEDSQRTPLRGPTFIRLLARLAGDGVPGDGPAPVERLGQWIDWTRAVALSRVLDGALPAGDVPAAAGDDDPAGDCAQAKAALVRAILDGPDMVADDPADAAEMLAEAALRHCRAMQRAMQAATGRLRGQLRDRLAAGADDAAGLAAIDAVMEQVLSPREQALLAAVPTLLGRHLARLRAAAEARRDGIWSGGTQAWAAMFRNDMRDVLLAELDLRFQPIEALLAALRPH